MKKEKRITFKELETLTVRLESEPLENSIKDDIKAPVLDILENALKDPIFFRIPTGIDREALHTYLQVQYKQHIDNVIMPLVKQLGGKIDE